MKLDVSATRHTSIPRRFLVGVQDQSGQPVADLSRHSFAFMVLGWGGSPVPMEVGEFLALPVDRCESRGGGFYDITPAS
jgi:hypothetical protein